MFSGFCSHAVMAIILTSFCATALCMLFVPGTTFILLFWSHCGTVKLHLQWSFIYLFTFVKSFFIPCLYFHLELVKCNLEIAAYGFFLLLFRLPLKTLRVMEGRTGLSIPWNRWSDLEREFLVARSLLDVCCKLDGKSRIIMGDEG